MFCRFYLEELILCSFSTLALLSVCSFSTLALLSSLRARSTLPCGRVASASSSVLSGAVTYPSSWNPAKNAFLMSFLTSRSHLYETRWKDWIWLTSSPFFLFGNFDPGPHRTATPCSLFAFRAAHIYRQWTQRNFFMNWREKTGLKFKSH